MKRFLLTLIMLFVLVLLIGVPVSAQEVGATEEAPSGEVETPPEVVTVPVDVVTNASGEFTLVFTWDSARAATWAVTCEGAQGTSSQAFPA